MNFIDKNGINGKYELTMTIDEGNVVRVITYINIPPDYNLSNLICKI